MKEPLISVVIPAYNSERTIGATIQSVLEQTFQDFEIIVVDDGSTDQTAQKVKESTSRARYVSQKNSGPAVTRNRGAAEANGKYIAFLDADDLWRKEKLEKQIRLFEKNPDLTAVQCGAYVVDNSMKVLEARPCRPDQDTFLDFLLFRNMPAFSSTLLVKKNRFEEVGGFSTDLIIEAWDMVRKLARDNKLKSVADCLVLYRRHSGNRSREVEKHIEAGFRSLGRLFADPTLDPALRRYEPRVWARFYAMLAGGYFHNKEWKSGLEWGARALKTSPSVSGYLLGLPFRKLQRAYIMKKKVSLAPEFPYAL